MHNYRDRSIIFILHAGEYDTMYYEGFSHVKNTSKTSRFQAKALRRDVTTTFRRFACSREFKPDADNEQRVRLKACFRIDLTEAYKIYI